MTSMKMQGSRGAGVWGRGFVILSALLHFVWQPAALVWLLIVGFAVFFGGLAVQQHRAFLTNGLDLGNVDQALWNTAQGRFLQFTLMAPIQSRLALHVEPILFFFVPFYWLDLGGPELLLVVQAAVVALGAWPVYQLSIRNYQLTNGEGGRPGAIVAFVFSGVYLSLPTLQAAVLFDFHAVTLAPTFLLFAFLALEQKKDRRFIGFALLAMACKEDIPFVVMMLGLYAGLAKRRWRLAGVTISLSLLWFSLAFFIIQPRFAAGGNIQLDRYTWLGDNPLDMAQTIITRPGLVFDHLWRQVDLPHYLGMLFFPTAFLALFSPMTLLPMLPPLAINLLSDNPFTWRLEDFHYGAPLAPFLLISTIYGIRHINEWANRQIISYPISVPQTSKESPPLPFPPAPLLPCSSFDTLRTRLAPLLLPLLSLLVLTFSLLYHFHRGFTPLAWSFQWPQVTAHERRLENLLAAIPVDHAVFSQSNLAPHLSRRATLYADFAYFTDPAFRTGVEPIDDIILDVTRLENIGGLHQFLRQRLLESGDYQVIEAQAGILHLRPAPPSLRLAASAFSLPGQFYTFTQADGRLDYPLQVDFGAIRLHGYSLHFNRQEEVQVTVDLELLRAAPASTRPVLFLLDAEGRLLGASVDAPPALAWVPVEAWPVGERVRVRFNTLPWYTRQMPAYRLALGMVEGDDVLAVNRRHRPKISQLTELAPRLPADESLLELALIEQVWAMPGGGPQLRQFKQPFLSHPIQADFSHQLQLLGYTTLKLPSPTSPSLSITLAWQAIGAPEPLTRFVQLIGPDGRVYGQQDSIPDWGLYPTDQWQPGEVVVEQVSFPVQVDRPDGPYRLHIGFYRPATGTRLPLLSGGDHVEIGLSGP